MRKNFKKKAAPRRKQDRKVKKVEKHFCTDQRHSWTKFEKTEKGVKRTCGLCGYEVTEIGRAIINTPLEILAAKKKSEYHPRRRANG